MTKHNTDLLKKLRDLYEFKEVPTPVFFHDEKGFYLDDNIDVTHPEFKDCIGVIGVDVTIARERELIEILRRAGYKYVTSWKLTVATTGLPKDFIPRDERKFIGIAFKVPKE